MFGREGERETSCRQWQISKQMHQGGDLGSPRIKDVHHCLIIATKQDVASRPLSSPNSGCKNNWEQFLLSDGLRLLWVHPGTAEPFTIEVNAPNPKDPAHLKWLRRQQEETCQEKARSWHHSMKTRRCATTPCQGKTRGLSGWGGLAYESSTTSLSYDARRYAQARQP